MSSRWNFKNNAEAMSNYKALDTNLDHYKSNRKPYRPRNNYATRDEYVEGVAIRCVDGSTYRTKDFTVDDIFDALHTHREEWLKLENGGEINLKYVVRYEPFKFYNKRENFRGGRY